ncbi:ATP-binding protein [Neobacillus niacini]|uniref:ATP-binding protein n=1 Tax=Neobacillus niacini TaxID=86668 RepID=UPI002040DDD0|nr:ATP-binding protein [Neobacillus niacini]MCM3691488.1 ATP-binding protein [Neobacillus niacini]
MELLRTQHPQINKVLDLFEEEDQPFRRIHRLIDAFETIIKTHTAKLIANYFHINHISDDIKGSLSLGLKIPSLGIWHEFSRKIHNDIMFNYLSEHEFRQILHLINRKEQKEMFTCAYTKDGDFYTYNRSSLKWLSKKITPLIINSSLDVFNKYFFKGFNAYFYQWDNDDISKVINTRNKYAHGATPHDNICRKDIEELLPILNNWLEAEWLQRTTICVFRRENDQYVEVTLDNNENSFLTEYIRNQIDYRKIEEYTPYLINQEGDLLNLFPIMIYKDLQETNVSSLMFFNDLKIKNTVSYLNYPHAIHIRDKDIYPDFLSIINIEDWRHKSTNEFKEKILELTDNFKGRKNELQQIQSYIENNQNGFYFLHGSPGIGKSSIIANALKNYRKDIYIIKYFIERQTISSQATYLLDFLNQTLEKISPTPIPMGVTLDEKRNLLHQRLLLFSQEELPKRLIIFIDGLDEGTENGLFSYLPAEVYKNIIIIYASRLTKTSEQFYLSLPIEHKTKLEIKGLTLEDIRSMLYEIMNKYEIQDDFVNKIYQRSKGNPLYLKLFCDSLMKKDYYTDDFSFLPESIEDFYHLILKRFGEMKNVNELFAALYLFAVAEESLSSSHLELILKIDSFTADQVLSSLQEVLTENDVLPNHYQLFHESFREYLYQKSNPMVVKSERILVSFCKDWHLYLQYDSQISSYPLKHYAKHLVHLNEYEQLFELAENQDFISMQVRRTRQYEHTFNLYQFALNQALVENDNKRLLEYGVDVAKLHFQVTYSTEENLHLFKMNHNIEILQMLLEHGTALNDNEQFNLYIALLSYMVYTDLDGTLKKNHIDLIVRHFDNHMVNNSKILNWAETSPFYFMVDILLRLHNLGVDISPIVKRANFENGFNGKQNLPFGLFKQSKGITLLMELEEVKSFLGYFDSCTHNTIYHLLSMKHLVSKNRSQVEQFIAEITNKKLNHDIKTLLQEIDFNSVQDLIEERNNNQSDVHYDSNFDFNIYTKDFALAEKVSSTMDRFVTYLELSLKLWNHHQHTEAIRLLKLAHETRDNDFTEWSQNRILEEYKTNFYEDILLSIIRKSRVDFTNDKEDHYYVELAANLIINNKLFEDRTEEIINLLSIQENYPLILKIYEKNITNKSIFEDEMHDLIPNATIALQLYNSGKYEEAFNYLIENDEVTLPLFCQVAAALRDTNQIEMSGKLINRVIASVIQEDFGSFESQFLKAFFITKYIEELNKYGFFDAVYKLIELGLKHSNVEMTMMQAEEQSDGILMGEAVNVSTVMAHQGNFDQAIDWIETKLVSLRHSFVNGSRFKNRAYGYVAIEMVKQGKLSDSMILCEKINDNIYRTIAYHGMAEELTKNGEIEEALNLCQQLELSEDQLEGYKKVAFALKAQGNHEKGLEILYSLVPIAEETIMKTMIEEYNNLKIKNQTQVSKNKQGNSNEIVTSESISFISENSLRMIPENIHDKKQLAKILYAYSIYIYYFSTKDEEKKSYIINKISDVLNLEKMQIAKVEYGYHNIGDWLQLITDDDDCMDIENWKQRVEKGKMTVEKFNAYIKNMLKYY